MTTWCSGSPILAIHVFVPANWVVTTFYPLSHSDLTDIPPVKQQQPPVPGIVYRPITNEVLPFRAVWSPRNDNPALRRLLSMARAMSNAASS